MGVDALSRRSRRYDAGPSVMAQSTILDSTGLAIKDLAIALAVA